MSRWDVRCRVGATWSSRDRIFRSKGAHKKGQLIESITLDEALALFRPEEKVFVIGGAQIYAQALPLCDEFYLTRVFHAYQGDTCFPRWDEREWEIIDSESFASGKEFPYPFAFEHYRRRK